MTDVDGELEKLRAEARHRLEGEKELEDKLAAYEAAVRAPRASDASGEDETSDVDEDSARPPRASDASREAASALAAQVAGAKAKETAAKVASFSTPRLLVLLAVIVLGGWIINNLIGPLIAVASLAIIGLLGHRFLRWLTSDPVPDDEDGAADDGEAEP